MAQTTKTNLELEDGSDFVKWLRLRKIKPDGIDRSMKRLKDIENFNKRMRRIQSDKDKFKS